MYVNAMKVQTDGPVGGDGGDRQLVRTPSKTNEHSPTVAICTKNATASGRTGQAVKPNKNNGMQNLPIDIPNNGESI